MKKIVHSRKRPNGPGDNPCENFGPMLCQKKSRRDVGHLFENTNHNFPLDGCAGLTKGATSHKIRSMSSNEQYKPPQSLQGQLWLLHLE